MRLDKISWSASIAPPMERWRTPTQSASAPPLGSYQIVCGPDVAEVTCMSRKFSLGPSYLLASLKGGSVPVVDRGWSLFLSCAHGFS